MPARVSPRASVPTISVRVMRVAAGAICGEFAFPIANLGRPHLGHAGARSETALAQSGHFNNPMSVSPWRPPEPTHDSQDAEPGSFAPTIRVNS